MSLIDETENDREISELRKKSLSFRILQLISYLELNTQMSKYLNVYATEIRVRGKITDTLHTTIFNIIEENKRLKKENEILKDCIKNENRI